MTDYYMPTVVRPTIPASCMTPIELWVLQNIFESEPDRMKSDEPRLYFFAWDFPHGVAKEDDALVAAVASPRSIELNKELCETLESARGEGDIDLDEIAIDYHKVLQGICARHSDKLPYVMVDSSYTCT